MAETPQDNSQTGTQAAAIASLDAAKAKGYISDKQHDESLAGLLTTRSGGQAKTLWYEHGSFPIGGSDNGMNVVRATKKVSKSGTVTYGVSLGIDTPPGRNNVTKRFIPLADVDLTVVGMRAMQKAAKAAEKAGE